MASLLILFYISFVVLAIASQGVAAGEQTLKDPTAEGPPKELVSELPPAALEEIRLFEEETVVTAVRHEQPISKAPSNVYVITDEDIRRSGATDLPTILRRVPGIEVMQVTGADFNVSARGDNQLLANKMLVLVDGRSIYEDTQGEVFWKSIPITLPEIKRIEVLKGPASALYGFNAFDGIIHIITKSPQEMKGTTLQVAGGEFGTLSAAAIQAGTFGDFGYRLSAGRDQNNQWQNRNALAFRADKFNIETQYNLSADSKVFLKGGLVDANRFDGPVVNILHFDSQPADGYASVGYERPNFFLRGWWKQHTDSLNFLTNPLLSSLQFTDRNGSTRGFFHADTYDVEAQHALDLGTQHRLTYGINYRYNGLSFNLIDRFSSEDRLGLYFQEEWRPLSALAIVAGARYDLHTEIHPTLSPRLAVLYEVAPDHTLRGAISVAYRPPTIAESHVDQRTVATVPNTFFPPPPASFTLTTIGQGSHGLNPEEIVSYELGYQGWYLKHRLRLRAEVFFNHLSNLIEFRTLILPSVFPPATGFAQSINDPGQADIYGGETGIEVVVTRWLSGFANFSYQEIGQSFTGNVTGRGAPRFKANAGLRGNWTNGLSAEALLYHVGAATYPLESAFFIPPAMTPDTRVGSYKLLNLRGAYRFWQDKAEVAVSVFNALNDRHKEHSVGDTIGSAVVGSLTISL